MSTNIKKGIAAAILVVVMIVMLANAFKSQTPAQATPAVSPTATPKPADVPSLLAKSSTSATAQFQAEAVRLATLDLQKKRKALAWGRNPFEPKVDKAALKAQLAKASTATRVAARQSVSPPALTIKAIMWGSARPMAVINNKVLAEGDIAPDGSRIVRIARNVVTVSKGGEEFHFSMKKPTAPK